MTEFRFETWPTEFMRINQYFGANPHNYAQFGLPGHEGIDIKAPSGSKIFTVAPGEVIRVRHNPHGHNYGIHVKVKHQDGYETTYAHLEQIDVSMGQMLAAGDQIGLADNTGNSFGSHLHLTLKRHGAQMPNWPRGIIDPLPFLLPLMGWDRPAGPYIAGWILKSALVIIGDLAQINRGGATLRVNADFNVPIPEGNIVVVRQQRDSFVYVQVARTTLDIDEEETPEPSEDPPPTIATIHGWVWSPYLTVVGERAVAGPHGVNVRRDPERGAPNIGLLKAGSTVLITGEIEGSYLPVTARRTDFMDPVALPDTLPEVAEGPNDDAFLGWSLSRYLNVHNHYAVVSRLGVNLRNRPFPDGNNIGLVKGYATVAIAGQPQGHYVPIRARRDQVINIAEPLPDIMTPTPIGDDEIPAIDEEAPLHDTTPGWVFKNAVTVTNETAIVKTQGANLRNAPRRTASKVGYVPPGARIIVTGRLRGEYHPVRVDDAILESATQGSEDDAQIVGGARIGLHAAADPDISYAEIETFRKMRPSMIKVLSFHSGGDIRQLAIDHPQAHFVLRAFLDFGGRHITPEQFLNDTLSDVERALTQLEGRKLHIELHNEPNLVAEGLGQSWRSGREFNDWWLTLLDQYRTALPNQRFIYPGLSPGSTVNGIKADHIQFIEASREAVEAADGLAIHTYWSRIYPMSRSLDVVDDYITRFRSKKIWITEASNNKGGTSAEQKAHEYLRFWQELQSRPTVQGVTYFVASASNPAFAEETWVGKGIAEIIGRR